jgi:molybdopterin molybdotransferase
MTVTTTWTQLAAWLGQHAPKALAVLRPGADDAAITAVETAVQATLPADLAELLRIHDGQQNRPFLNTVAGFMLLPCRDIVEAWREYAELVDAGDLDKPAESKDDTVRPVWWSKRWVPFAEGAGGDLLCVDLDPGAKGRVGQVLRFWHDEPWRQQLAASVGALLDDYLRDLRAGKYRVGGTGGLELA